MKKFLFICLVFGWSQLALAFRLDPMVIEFDPTGPNQSKVFRVENNGQERIAVQLKATTRSANLNGEETREPTTDFSIYPEQLSLGPNDIRNVRVTYKGSKDLTSEKSYRLIASQLPVDFKTTKPDTQLNFLFEYVASVYVRSENSAPKLEVKEIQPSGGSKIRVVLQNTGTAHRLLRGVSIAVTNEAGKTVALNEKSFKDWPSENLLAGATREFQLESKEPLNPKQQLKASVQIKDQP